MEPGQIYHVYNHANGFENLFKEDGNYVYFLDQFEKIVFPYVNLYAFCLLPNHFHFLLKIKSEKELLNLPGFQNLEGLQDLKTHFSKKVNKTFSNFFNSYSKAFNKAYGRRGSLFEKSFKRKLIETDVQFQETFLYANLNAVKHKFVETADTWHWSSLRAYLRLEQTSLLSREESLNYFDSYDNLKFCLEEKQDFIIQLNME
ncbi:transposase [Fulvivirga sp. RKSG066]|uniref:transposase n=1 Tax=Fulvivirga aurantia TaxID=2529383 RepID=UPI0012BC30A2|nr:transposase [Fulvivirga aurantia]MTI22808.1 transposase [Fulvivirga aurantia]